MKNYYHTLNISENASAEEIKSAYRDLVKFYHPDRLKSFGPKVIKDAEEKMKEINEAYGVLSDPEKRSQYDQKFKQNSNEEDSDVPQERKLTGIAQKKIEKLINFGIFYKSQN